MSSRGHVPQQRIVVLLLLALAAVGGLATGCGKPTKESIDRWTGSEAGLRRIRELVSDPESERGLQLYALTKLCRNGYCLKSREMLHDLADAAELTHELAQRLLAMLGESGPEDSARVKDALLQLLPALPESDRDAIRKRIAAWAFDGLPVDADSDTVRKWFETRIGMNQLPDLGVYGVKGATLLMGYGFGVQELYAHLYEMNDPEVDRQILAAFERLHKVPNIDIPLDHLDKIHRLRIPEAVVYLLRLYSNRGLPADIRGDAFALAIRAFQQPEIRAAPDKLLPGLFQILSDASNDDRRLAIHYILRLGGIAQLKRVLAMLDDDPSFQVNDYDTPRFARDICRDDVLKLRGDPIPILLEAASNASRLARMLSVICLKLSGRLDVLLSLEALLENPTPLHDFLAEGMTLGDLARNAVDGLRAIDRLTHRRDAGRLDEERYETLRSLYEDELRLCGAELDAAVKKRDRARRKKVRRGEELP